MFFIIIAVIFIGYVAAEVVCYKALLRLGRFEREAAQNNCDAKRKELTRVEDESLMLESRMAEHFFFYELIRKLSSILDKDELYGVFCSELKYLGDVQMLELSKVPKEGDYLEFRLGTDEPETLRVKTSSKKVVEYLPYLAKILNLCIERINLYEKLHQLSVNDPLTDTYNRRYFMLRYMEEFNRAREYNLNLSFIMLDIDFFKQVNDTYGHLVGDAVLRATAAFIKENIREIDFVARFGGEEFALILTETDKNGAIMVAERIRNRIACEKIRAFDEMVSVTVSAGVASVPQNTFHSDILLETADKALYKAKTSGRNRVSWF